MIPLTFIAVAWIFHPSVVDWGQLSGLPPARRHRASSRGLGGHGWLTVYIAYSFLLTWNVIAMEAAACYIGECKDPERDAKIAMNLEGGYGLFIYTLIPIAFIIVLGAKALSNPALVDPKTIFVTFAGKVFGSRRRRLNWLIALMLIVALALSALNAIMGCARSLHQMSVDGQFPRFFQKINKHGVPDRAMAFNVVCSLVVDPRAAARSRSTRSRTSATRSRSCRCSSATTCCASTSRTRGGRCGCPSSSSTSRSAMAVLYFVIWLYGGIMLLEDRQHARLLPRSAGACSSLYLPLYWYRTRVEDKRLGAEPRSPTRSCRRGRAVEVTPATSRAPRRRRLARDDGPDPDALAVRAVLLASEDREIPTAAVDLAARIAKRSGAPVHVFTIARIWGTSFGFPNPGLNPTKREWDQQRHNVEKAIGAPGAQGRRGRRRASSAPGRGQADRPRGGRLDCDAIVMARRPDRHAADPQLHLAPGAVARAAQGARAGPPRGRPDGLTSPARSRRSWPASAVRGPRRGRAGGRRRGGARSCAGATDVLVEDGAPPTRSSSWRPARWTSSTPTPVVDVLEPGQCFGHPSLLTGLAPAFTVRAARGGDDVVLPRAAALRVFAQPAGAEYLASSLRRRLVRTGHTATACPS